MFIQTEATPNPATLKFLPGRPVLPDGVLDIPDAAQAGKSPLAERLFAVPGVTGKEAAIAFTQAAAQFAQLLHRIKNGVSSMVLDGLSQCIAQCADILAQGSIFLVAGIVFWHSSVLVIGKTVSGDRSIVGVLARHRASSVTILSHLLSSRVGRRKCQASKGNMHKKG